MLKVAAQLPSHDDVASSKQLAQLAHRRRPYNPYNIPALIDAEKAAQLPKPVRNEKNASKTKCMEASPSSKAFLSGKYPAAKHMQPKMTDGLGPLLSTKRPTGTPDAYMPRFPIDPIMLLCVEESPSLSANCGPHAEYA